MGSSRLGGASVVALVCLGGPLSASGQEWPHPGRDPGATRHSPLTQIDRSNINRLEVAWTFDTGDWSDGKVLPSRSSFAATPLVVEVVLYIPSSMSRLFALDAETGQKLWVFAPAIDKKVPQGGRPGRAHRLGACLPRA